MITYHRITIMHSRRPADDELNRQLQWFGNSLGLFGERDRDRSCFRIFIELMKCSRENTGLTSDDLADRAHLSRGTVVHHLHTLMESGIVVHDRKLYHLRVNNLKTLVDELQKDIDRTMDDLREMASRIDREIKF